MSTLFYTRSQSYKKSARSINTCLLVIFPKSLFVDFSWIGPKSNLCSAFEISKLWIFKLCSKQQNKKSAEKLKNTRCKDATNCYFWNCSKQWNCLKPLLTVSKSDRNSISNRVPAQDSKAIKPFCTFFQQIFIMKLIHRWLNYNYRNCKSSSDAALPVSC